MRYRKKSVVIDATQYDGSVDSVARFMPSSYYVWDAVGATLEIFTDEGTMTAKPGDWIIKGIKGEFYPCKPDIFAATYEPAE